MIHLVLLQPSQCHTLCRHAARSLGRHHRTPQTGWVRRKRWCDVKPAQHVLQALIQNARGWFAVVPRVLARDVEDEAERRWIARAVVSAAKSHVALGLTLRQTTVAERDLAGQSERKGATDWDL